MNKRTGSRVFRWSMGLLLTTTIAILLAPAQLSAQVFTLSKEELIELTPIPDGWERFPDGRPRIPDNLLERARELSSEEMMGNNYTDGFRILHPGKKMVGRAFTVMFLPARPELDGYARSRAKAKGITTLNNQTVIDMLGPGDVICVDLFGKKEGGTFVGDNLFYYIMRATKPRAWSSTDRSGTWKGSPPWRCPFISSTPIQRPSAASPWPAGTSPSGSVP